MRGYKTVLAVAAVALGLMGGILAATADAGDVVLRLRGLALKPSEDTPRSTIGGQAEIETGYGIEVNGTYFATRHVALDLSVGTANHDVSVTNSNVGDVDLGSVRLLPTTLSLQYHFAPNEERFRPYAGVGLTYVHFYGVDEPSGVSVDYDDTVGVTLQAGIDIGLTDNVVANFDVRKTFVDTGVDVNNGAVTADVDINPFTFGAGIGFRF